MINYLEKKKLNVHGKVSFKMYIRSKGKNKNNEIQYAIMDNGKTIKYLGTAKKILQMIEKNKLVPKTEEYITKEKLLKIKQKFL